MPSWRTPRSEVVGGGSPKSGSIFRALVPLACGACARTIAPGETFTRGTQLKPPAAGSYPAQRVLCAACGLRPVSPAGDGP